MKEENADHAGADPARKIARAKQRTPASAQAVAPQVSAMQDDRRTAKADTTAGGDSGPVGTQAGAKELTEFCAFHEGYVSRNIQLADAKAGVVLVAFSGAVTLLLRDKGFLAALRDHWLAIWPFSAGFSHSGTMAWAAILLCAPAIILAFLVIVPRVGSGVREPGEKLGVTYWGDVAARTGGEAYARDVRSLPAEDLIGDRLTHLYQLSAICARKMWLLQFAMWIGGAGVITAMAWIVRFADHLE